MILLQLAIINADLDIVEVLEKCEFQSSVTTEDLNETEMEARPIDKRPNGDVDFNMFKIERGDSEVVTYYKEIMKFIFLPAILIMGIRVNYNWKPHRQFMFWFTYSNLIFAWICFLYTHYLHTKNNEMIRNLEVFACYGVGLSVRHIFGEVFHGKSNFFSGFFKCIFKSGNYLLHFKKILALLEFMLQVCRQNSNGRRAILLKTHLKKCYKSFILFAVCISANACLFLSVPVISYLVKKELIALVPCEVPFIDQSTLSGYLTANVIMSVNGVLAACGTIFSATSYILLITNYTVQVELIGDDFDCLDEMWADKKQPLRHKRAFLRSICMRCQDMDK